MPDVVAAPVTDPPPPVEPPVEPPSQLIPGNIPFPPPGDGNADDRTDGIVLPPPPPPMYPPLPRGLKPPVPPTEDEREALATMRAMQDFFRASAYHHGDGRGGGRGRRAREGDVTRWRDASGDEASGSGRTEETVGEAEEDDDDGICDVKWIARLAKGHKLEDYPVMDERIVPREILDVVFGREATTGGAKKKKRDDDGDDDDGNDDDGMPTSPKRARRTSMNNAQSRLERLVRLEQKADEEARATRRRGRTSASPHARRSKRGGGASSTPGRDHDDEHSGDDVHSDDGYDENADEGGLARRGEDGGRAGESRLGGAEGRRERGDDLRGRDEEDDDSGSDGDYGRAEDFDDDDDGFDDDRDDQAEAFY